MCTLKNKWKDFTPTKQYLSIVSGLTSVTKLHNYLKQFKPKAEKPLLDYWKTPVEFVKDGEGDCEDFARFAIDVLVRIQKINEARFVISSGYDKSRWGNKIWNVKCHAICVFPYKGKMATFDFNKLFIGLSNYEGAGHITFPDGLKFQEIRDWKGKVLKRKFKIFGVF